MSRSLLWLRPALDLDKTLHCSTLTTSLCSSQWAGPGTGLASNITFITTGPKQKCPHSHYSLSNCQFLFLVIWEYLSIISFQCSFYDSLIVYLNAESCIQHYFLRLCSLGGSDQISPTGTLSPEPVAVACVGPGTRGCVTQSVCWEKGS